MGYVEEDEATILEVNKRAVWDAVTLVVIGLVIYLAIEAVMKLIHWIGSFSIL